MRHTARIDKLLYYIAFSIYIFFSACSHSRIVDIGGVERIIQLGRYFAVALMLCKFFMNRRIKISIFLAWIIGIVITSTVFVYMDSTLPLILILVVLSSRDCEGKILAKIYLWATGIVVIGSTVLSQIGIIQDKVYIRRATGAARHALGMQYVTVWAAFVYFLICAYIYYREEIRVVEAVIILLLDMYLYAMTDARLEAGMIILAMIICMIYKSGKLDNKVVRFFLRYSMLISCSISFLVQYLYMMNPVRYQQLDNVLSKRLSLTAGVINEQGFHLFGKNFFMQGFGTKDFDWSLGYNYVDSFYINYTLRYGIILMLFLCILFSVVCNKLCDNGNDWLLIFFAFGAMHGFVISSIFLPQCNPFFVIAFAEYTNIGKNGNILKGVG